MHLIELVLSEAISVGLWKVRDGILWRIMSPNLIHLDACIFYVLTYLSLILDHVRLLVLLYYLHLVVSIHIKFHFHIIFRNFSWVAIRSTDILFLYRFRSFLIIFLLRNYRLLGMKSILLIISYLVFPPLILIFVIFISILLRLFH